MIAALEVTVLVACGLLALFGLVSALVDRPPDRLMRLAVGVVVALLVVQAAIAAFRVVTGVVLPETSTFLIYLAVSVGVLPIALQFATATETPAPETPAPETPAPETPEPEGPTRWGGTVIAVGAIATAVAVIRLQFLWDAGHV